MHITYDPPNWSLEPPLQEKNSLAHFLPFLGPLQAIKHHQTIFSCRGVSKLQFGGSYVKIGQELASEMSF